MEKIEINEEYAELEKQFVTYANVSSIKNVCAATDCEPFCEICEQGIDVVGKPLSILANNEAKGSKILTRKTVLDKLKQADKTLKEINKFWQLVVVYGYRSLEVQKKKFEREYNALKNLYKNEAELLEIVHRKIAVPEVAGHPTGGAVDVVIFDNDTNKFLDFGTQPLDLSTKRMYYRAIEKTDPETFKNRETLREIMIKQNFAPYDGEWWHFSYGDKEWAFYYNQKSALYNAKMPLEIKLKGEKVYGKTKNCITKRQNVRQNISLF